MGYRPFETVVGTQVCIQDWPLEVTAALEGHWCQLRLGWVEPSKWELLWRATSTGWDYFGGVPDGVGWELL